MENISSGSTTPNTSGNNIAGTGGTTAGTGMNVTTNTGGTTQGTGVSGTQGTGGTTTGMGVNTTTGTGGTTVGTGMNTTTGTGGTTTGTGVSGTQGTGGTQAGAGVSGTQGTGGTQAGTGININITTSPGAITTRAGALKVQCFRGDDYIPIDRARITVRGTADTGNLGTIELVTNPVGLTDVIELTAPPLEYSLNPNSTQRDIYIFFFLFIPISNILSHQI